MVNHHSHLDAQEAIIRHSEQQSASEHASTRGGTSIAHHADDGDGTGESRTSNPRSPESTDGHSVPESIERNEPKDENGNRSEGPETEEESQSPPEQRVDSDVSEDVPSPPQLRNPRQYPPPTAGWACCQCKFRNSDHTTGVESDGTARCTECWHRECDFCEHEV